MSVSIKQQVIEYLERNGYKFDPGYKGHKYRKLIHDRYEPIYVGHTGAFRKGSTIADSISITDKLRALLSLPAYGEAGACETCGSTGYRVNARVARAAGIAGKLAGKQGTGSKSECTRKIYRAGYIQACSIPYHLLYWCSSIDD
jgi:hypothetical protein